MLNVSREKRRICVSSSVALLACQTPLQRSASPATWLGRLRRDGGLGPNQEETARRLKSRSTSRPPPSLPLSLSIFLLSQQLPSLPLLLLPPNSSPSPFSVLPYFLSPCLSPSAVTGVRKHVRRHGRGVCHFPSRRLTLLCPGGL